MQLVADFHLHSKYSRAVSQNMVLQTMADVAIEKGIDLLTASDFTHPLWFKEIQNQLKEKGEGVYVLKSEYRNPKFETNSWPKANQPMAENIQNPKTQKEPKFILSTEISCIYSQGGKLRRIHNLIFAPNVETVEKITAEMKKRGYNLHSDGRPIIGLPSRDLLEMILSIDKRCMLIPCHVWTPHFGLYGSLSGFDSIEEAFGDLKNHIYAVETGLSSDPEMNWQIPELEKRSILSFSDAHSPAKMGREATVFVTKDGMSNDKFQISNDSISYEDIRQAIMRTSDRWKVGYTIEFYPEEGKYHYSGHRNCKVSKSPSEVEKDGIACPVCRKRLTEGVFVRLKNLSRKEHFEKPLQKQNATGLTWYTDPQKHHPPFVKLVPLLEIIAEAVGSTVMSQKTKNLYTLLIKTYGSEFEVLLKTPIADIATQINDRVAQGIGKVRKGDIDIHPGYDGEYGIVKIWGEGKDVAKDTDESPQLSLEL